MSNKSTRILLLGKKTQEGKTLQEFMPEQFPVEGPAEYIFSIKIITGKDKKIELDPDKLITPLDLQDLSSFYRQFKLKEHIDTIEVYLDLQLIQEKMLKVSSKFIENIFPKD